MAFDWKKTLASVAPGLAGLLGGPLAGMAAGAVVKALGLPDGSPEEEIETALQNMTPDHAVKLKESEAKLAIEMKKAGVDIYKISVEDRKSAREREQAVGSSMLNGLAFLIVAAFIGVVVYILMKGLPVDAEGRALDAALVGSLIGYLAAKAEQVVSYFFGSSAGSARKTEQLVMR